MFKRYLGARRTNKTSHKIRFLCMWWGLHFAVEALDMYKNNGFVEGANVKLRVMDTFAEYCMPN